MQATTDITTAQLNAQQITCQRGFRTLFKALNLSLTNGHVQHITGANGAGKTSLLRILAGLSEPESGNVQWNKVSVTDPAAGYHHSLSFLGHRPALKSAFTPVENLVAHAMLHQPMGRREWMTSRAVEALQMMDITYRQDRPIALLSAGQRQRVALARVAMLRRPLWILDEPATALDQSGIAHLEKILDIHIASGGLVVYTSHQPLSFSAGAHRALNISDFT